MLPSDSKSETSSQDHVIGDEMMSHGGSCQLTAKSCRESEKKLKYCNDKTNSETERKCFMRVRTFVTCLAMLQLVQVMGSGYSKSALTSIERRYRLSSFSVGILQSCFHVGNLSVILFVSYFGSKWHRPRAIAIGSLLMAISSALSAMPQFVGDRYDVTQRGWAGSPLDERLTHEFKGSGNRRKNETEKEVLMKNITSFLVSNPEGFSNEDIISSTLNRGRGVGLNYNVTLANLIKNRNTSTSLSNSLEISESLSHALQYSSFSSDNDNNAQAEISRTGLCESTNNRDRLMSQKLTDLKMKKMTRNDDSSLYIFIAAGSVLKGMGHTPLHPLGMSFIDDFAAPRNSALYIGLVTALSLLGPAVGFLLGSFTTTIWVDCGWVNTTSLPIDPHDPAWVGAWWMGYLLTSFLLLMATIPLFMFPRKISREEESKETESVGCLFCMRKYCSNKYDEETCSEPETELPDPEETDSNPIFVSSFTNEEINGFCSKSSLFLSSKQFKMSSRFSIPKVEFRKGSSTVSRDFRRSVSAPLDQKRALSIELSRTCSLKIAESKVILKERITKRTHSALAMKDFTVTLKSLLKDPLFMSITMGFVSLTSFLASSITYVSKYMESQFDLTASLANLLNGSVNLPMAVVGNVAGGFIIRRRNLNVKQTISLVLVGLSVTIMAVFTLFIFGCQGNIVVGFNDKNSNCYEDCGCSDVYLPVCDDATSTTYRSACFAGCSQESLVEGKKIYSNCRCLTGRSFTAGSYVSDANSTALSAGACKGEVCWRELSVFVAVMGVASMAAGLASTPSTLTILRVVEPSVKAFAIGIVFVFTRSLAWIPSPVYVGSAIDSSCLQWSRDSDQQKRCEVYNKELLRRCLFGATGVQLLCAAAFYMLALYLVTRRHRHKARGRLLHGDVIIVMKKEDIETEKDETFV